jgi:hypothetical protein
VVSKKNLNDVQSVPITAKVESSKPVHGEVNLIQHYVIKFVSDLYSSTVIEYFIWIESLLRDHLSYKATFCPKRWPLNTGLTVLLLSRKQLQTDHIGDVMLKSACLEYECLVCSCEWASDCWLVQNEQLFSYIMDRTSSISMRLWWCPLCTRPTHLVKIVIVLTHWNNSIKESKVQYQ